MQPGPLKGTSYLALKEMCRTKGQKKEQHMNTVIINKQHMNIVIINRQTNQICQASITN